MAESITQARLTKAIVRFWSMVKVAGKDSCWLWSGCVNKDGYPLFRGELVRRLAFKLFREPVPRGRYVLNSCREKACLNPRHLQLSKRSLG